MTQSNISKLLNDSFESSKKMSQKTGPGEYMVVSGDFAKMWDKAIEEIKLEEMSREREDTLNKILKK